MSQYYSDPNNGCSSAEKKIEFTLNGFTYNICSPKCIQDINNSDPILSKLINICPKTPKNNAACIAIDKANNTKYCVKECTNYADNCNSNEECIVISTDLRICSHKKR